MVSQRQEPAFSQETWAPEPIPVGSMERAMAERDRWLVVCPAYRHIEPETEAMLGKLQKEGIPVQRHVGGSDIARVRSVIAEEAIQRGSERILWIDADTFMSPLDCVRLLLAEEDLITAVSPARGEFRLLMESPGPFTLGPGGGIVPIRWCGFGCIVTSGTALRAVQALVPRVDDDTWSPMFCPMIVERPDGSGHAYLAEDRAFCWRATMQAGLSLWADTRIRVGHVGRLTYHWEHALGMLGPGRLFPGSIRVQHEASPTPEPDVSQE